MQTFRTVAFGLLSFVSAYTGLATPVLAEERPVEFSPEVNAYLKLSDTARIFLLGDVTKKWPENSTNGELGVHFDLTIQPILRAHLRDADWERNRYLWIRVGYRLLSSIDGRESGFTEHRIILEATGRFELPADVWLVNRARVDLRDVDGVISERFRYRLGIEKEFTVQGLTLVPNAQAEFFYDTRFSDWSRQRYQAGVEISLTDNVRLEPYVAYEKDVLPTTTDLYRLGLVLKYYW